MSIRAQLLQWLLALPPILDGAHAPIARPARAAETIATVAAETEDPRFFAAALDVFAAHESGYRPRAAGDCPGLRAGDPTCARELGARSCGAWQTPCDVTSKDPTEQARQWVAILRRSRAACPAHPFAVLATGRCIAWGASREAEIARALEIPLPAEDAPATAATAFLAEIAPVAAPFAPWLR
jgi:hypothetical protein